MKTGQVELTARDQSVTGVQPSVTADALQEAIDAVAAGDRLKIEDRLALLRSALGADAGLLDAVARFEQDEREMPGPTGEANLLSVHPRGIVVCAGPSDHSAVSQALQALLTGNGAVVVVPGADRLMESWSRLPVVGVDASLAPSTLSEVNGFDAVASTAESETLRSIRRALAARAGAIVPLITEGLAPERYVIERHLCIDTTASGGNASLLASVEN
jgi:RHH-type proline utilization regulon transcriptional repressor/proline dehydrogenase/delta 1-pyrroline-5-carboxylate dehydrogenase